jgi:DNA polymerase III epsilon subunit-like protein
MTNTWTLIDTETDGLYAPIHVIDIAAQKFHGLEPVGEPFQVLINHGIRIPPEATAVHGYTTDFILRHGIDPGRAYRALRSYIGNDPVVSHNVSFDWDRVLMPEWARLREEPIGRRGFCALLLSRRALPEHPTHRLDYLRDYHGLACSRPHSALGDVEATADLLTRIIFPRLTAVGFGSVDGVHEFVSLRPVLRCRCLIQGLDYEEEAQKARAARKGAQNAAPRLKWQYRP